MRLHLTQLPSITPRPASRPATPPQPAKNDESNPIPSWYAAVASTIVHTESTLGHAQSAPVHPPCAAYHHVSHAPAALHRPAPPTVAPAPRHPEPADTTPPAGAYLGAGPTTPSQADLRSDLPWSWYTSVLHREAPHSEDRAPTDAWSVRVRMDVEQRLSDDLKEAMRSGDTQRREAIRMLRAALKNEHIALRHPLTEQETTAVVSRIAKRHRESIDQFRDANRQDLVAHEEAQLATVERYLPQLMSREAVEAEVKAVMATMETSGPRAQGQLMSALSGRLRGKADMKLVSTIVKDLLGTA